jgi:hypothetical protein
MKPFAKKKWGGPTGWNPDFGMVITGKFVNIGTKELFEKHKDHFLPDVPEKKKEVNVEKSFKRSK